MLNSEIIEWSAHYPHAINDEHDAPEACLKILPAIPNACGVRKFLNSTSRGNDIHATRMMVAAWLRELKFWNRSSVGDGSNHVLLDYYDIDDSEANRLGKRLLNNDTLVWNETYNYASMDAGNAIILGSSLLRKTIRKGFDLPIVLSQISPHPSMSTYKKTFVEGGLTGPNIRHHPVGDRPKLSCFYGSVYGTCCEIRRIMRAAAMKVHNHSVLDFGQSDRTKGKEIIGKQYGARLGKCQFGLVMRGQGYHSFRLEEVLAAGTIPVIINDDGVLPFQDDWDWDSFSVMVSENETIASGGTNVISLLKEIASDEDRMLKMQKKAITMFETNMVSKSKLWSHTFDLLRRNVERAVSESGKCE